MKRPVWLVLGAIIAIILVWLGLRSGSGEVTAVDLVAQFPSATQKRPSPECFSIVDAAIGGQTKKSILVKDPAQATGGLTASRLVYSLTVPENARLKIDLGILEAGWTVPGDGVLFRVLLAPSNLPPEEILNHPINPNGNPGDRRWHEVDLDLSEYAGETVELFFNTNSTLPVARGQAPRDDRNGDLAVWGTPRIVTE